MGDTTFCRSCCFFWFFVIFPFEDSTNTERNHWINTTIKSNHNQIVLREMIDGFDLLNVCQSILLASLFLFDIFHIKFRSKFCRKIFLHAFRIMISIIKTHHTLSNKNSMFAVKNVDATQKNTLPTMVRMHCVTMIGVRCFGQKN